MVALYILLVLGVVALWFLLSCIYRPLGKFIYRIGKDAVDEINKDEKKEEEKMK